MVKGPGQASPHPCDHPCALPVRESVTWPPLRSTRTDSRGKFTASHAPRHARTLGRPGARHRNGEEEVPKTGMIG